MSSLLAPRHWGGHLLMVLAVVAAVLLGLWQLAVWEAARTAEARDLSQEPPRPLTSVMSGDDVLTGEDLGRPVTFSGAWMPESTLYVADRRQDGRTGYWVTTPVRVEGSGSAVPVVRGWAPSPEAPAPEGEVALTGWLQASEGSGAVDDDPDDDVIAEMRIASIVQHVDADLYSAYVVAQQPDAGLVGVTPDAIPAVSASTSLRNLLYAVQWWVFGGFAVYVWVRWCRDVLEAEREDPTREPVASGV